MDELVLLTEAKIVESTHLCYHEVISVVITNCSRDGQKSRHGLRILSLSRLGIFRMVGVVSVIQDVCYGSHM